MSMGRIVPIQLSLFSMTFDTALCVRANGMHIIYFIKILIKFQTESKRSKRLTNPAKMQNSCTTSVYATEYNPPNRVYTTTTIADTIIDVVLSRSMITLIVPPLNLRKLE